MAKYLRKPNKEIVERVQAEAFAALTPERSGGG